MDKREIQLLTEISRKLDQLIGIHAIQGREQDEQIEILRGMGLNWDFVCGVVGLKPAAAKKRLQRRNKA